MQERYKNFTLLITQIGRSIRKIKAREMAAFDLKSAHVSCIYYLYTMQSLTAKELCDICEEDKAAVSRSIEYLENNGYLESTDKENRKYKRPLELTEKGREIGKRLTEQVEKILDISGDALPAEERDVMYRSLGVINENLQKICKEYEN